MNGVKNKKDIYLIAGFLIVAIILYVVIALIKKEGSKVIVTVDKKIVYETTLDKDQIYEIKTSAGSNTLVIKNGEAYISRSDCKDHLCENQGRIKKAGQSIICLPHKVVVEVKQDGANVDAVSE